MTSRTRRATRMNTMIPTDIPTLAGVDSALDSLEPGGEGRRIVRDCHMELSMHDVIGMRRYMTLSMC